MPDLMHVLRVPGPCRFCGAARDLSRVHVISKGRKRKALEACAVCLSRCIDEALGWSISNQVRQGIAAAEAARGLKTSIPGQVKLFRA